MTVRIKDIAQSLNLSPATVSLVLNNKPGVGAETRERVMSYINENGFNINTSKKISMSNKSIGFIVYKKHGKVVSDTPFFSQVIEGIESEARKYGYNLTVTYIDKAEENIQLMRYLSQNPPEGIILLATEMERQNLAEFEKMSVPIVLLDNSFAQEHIDSVSIGNEQGSYEAVSYLIEMGHRAIGYLHSAVQISNFDYRQEGCRRALSENGIPLREEYVYSVDSTIDGACSDMRRLLENAKQLPTAVFADNDIIALGAVRAMKECGLRVPEDISVIGFDDMPYCDLNEPPLSTVRVFKQYMGKLSVRRLVEKMESNTTEYVRTEVGTQLVKRKSVSVPRKTKNMNRSESA